MSVPNDIVQQFCSQCGEGVDSDARFCKHCAFELNRQKSVSSNSPVAEELPSRPNRIPIILGSLAVIAIGVILLTIYLQSRNGSSVVGPNQNLQLISNAPLNSNSQQVKTGVTTPVIAATVAPTTVSSDNEAPSEQRVEAAVKKAFARLKQEGKVDLIPGVRVAGIQMQSGLGGAKGDVELTNAVFLRDDLLHGQWQIGPSGIGGRMVYPKQRIRIENCSAMLKHYTNGHWVLESLDTRSSEFGVIKINIEI